MFEPDTWAGDSYLRDEGVLSAFEQARMPKARPDQVKPLNLSIERIDQMLEEAEKWYVEQ